VLAIWPFCVGARGKPFSAKESFGNALSDAARGAGLIGKSAHGEARYRARAHPGAPQGFGDVLDPPYRNPRQIHLDQRFFDRALPSTVTLNDRRLKGLSPKRRDLEIDLTSTGLQRAFIAASPGVLPSLAAFVSTGPTQPVSFGIEQSIERLPDCPANHLPEMIPDPGFIDLDDLANNLRHSSVV
jgi:hypothetical protein